MSNGDKNMSAASIAIMVAAELARVYFSQSLYWSQQAQMTQEQQNQMHAQERAKFDQRRMANTPAPPED